MKRKLSKIVFTKGNKVFKDNGEELIGEVRTDILSNEELGIKHFWFYGNVTYLTAPEGFCIEDDNGDLRDPFTKKVIS